MFIFRMYPKSLHYNAHWDSVVLLKPIVDQLVRNSYACYGTRKIQYYVYNFTVQFQKLLIRKRYYVLFLIPVFIVQVTKLVQFSKFPPSTSMYFATRVRTAYQHIRHRWRCAAFFLQHSCNVTINSHNGQTDASHRFSCGRDGKYWAPNPNYCTVK
jgi:hypothetical protein